MPDLLGIGIIAVGIFSLCVGRQGVVSEKFVEIWSVSRRIF